MSEINYVMREEGTSELISAESDLDFLFTDDILSDYPYILDAMKKEEYYIENEMCSFFDEIVFENKVVGFATFEIRNYSYLLLTECFILPEFRGNRLFFDEICKMIFVGPKFGILQPTRNIVELLLDYAFAKNVNDDIVASAVDFHFDDFDAKSTKNRELDEDEMSPSNFYDLSICSTIFVEDDEVIYHELLENDLNRYGKRKKLSKAYFNSLIELFSKNEGEFEELILELKEELPHVEFGFNEVVGRGDGLSELMKNMVDEELISYEKALEIKEQLTKEYDAGEIDDNNVADRLILLTGSEAVPIGDFSDFKDYLNTIDEDDEDLEVIKDFFNAVGDDQELGNNLLQAVLSDNQEAFYELIINQMDNDEEFTDNFLDFAENIEDDGFDEYPPMNISDLVFGYKHKPKYKLDDTNYGKDYPISYDIDIYHVLSQLNEGFDLDAVIDFIDLEISYNVDLLISLMLQSGFIEKYLRKGDWNDFSLELTKNELKEVLRENGLKVSGNKPELVDRLNENDVPIDERFRITQKGKDYLKDIAWVEYYDEFLYAFDFNDFVKYWETHGGKLKEISLNYIEEHSKLARKNQDDEYLRDCDSAREYILDEADYLISDLNIPE